MGGIAVLIICCYLVLMVNGSYHCGNPSDYADKGKWYSYQGCGKLCKECVALIRGKCNAPRTSNWARGIQVRGNGNMISKGTAIATFEGPSGSYGGHAAIYLFQDSTGITVCNHLVFTLEKYKIYTSIQDETY